MRYQLSEFDFDSDVKELAGKIYDAVDGKIDDTLLFAWIGDIHLYLKQDAVHGRISPSLAEEYQKHFWGFYR